MELHVGLDLGQSQHYSALVVLEPTDVSLVRYLHRWPLGTSYPVIVSDVDAIM